MNHHSTVKEKDCAANAAQTSEVDDSWLMDTRIKGMSGLVGMSQAVKAAVASPVVQAPPDINDGSPAWMRTMRKQLAGKVMPGEFVPDDVIEYVERFSLLSEIPVPAGKGVANWRQGALSTMEQFYGALHTLYENKKAPMPSADRQRRAFKLCVDLFFAHDEKYGHINASTPRSLVNQMPSLLADLMDIYARYQLPPGIPPNHGHITGWIESQKGVKDGRTRRQSKRNAGYAQDDGAVQKSDEQQESDRQAAIRIVARERAGKTGTSVRSKEPV